MPVQPRLPRGLRWRGGTIHTDFRTKDGRRIRESLDTSDPREAEAKLGAMKAALFAGTFVPSVKGAVAGSLSLARAFDLATEGSWLLSASRKTVKSAHHNFQRLTDPDEGAVSHLKPIREFDKAECARIQRELLKSGLSPSTVNTRMWVLKACLEAALDEGAITEMPALPKTLSTKGNARQRYLTPEEERLVLEYLSTDDRFHDLKDAWVIMLDTGMRVNEAARLERRDVDWRMGTVKVRAENSKNSDVRVLPMTARVRAIMERRLADPKVTRAFPTESRDPDYWAYRFGDLWREARTELGLEDVVCHTARHTVGTRLMAAGTDIRTAMAVLGQRTPEMTLRYAKVVADNVRDAIGALERVSQGEGSVTEEQSQERHKQAKSQ